jgi:hypothetical protein
MKRGARLNTIIYAKYLKEEVSHDETKEITNKDETHLNERTTQERSWKIGENDKYERRGWKKEAEGKRDPSYNMTYGV